MKKILVLVLALVMVCASLTFVHAEEEMPHFKFGVIYYSLTDTLGTETVNMCQKFADMFGCEVQFQLATSSDENITGVENLCASGCQAIISCFVDAGLPRVLQICDEYGVYFGAISRVIPSEEIQKTVEAMPSYKWWIGGVHENELEAGYAVIKGLADKGCTKFALVGNVPGASSAHDDRWTGFHNALDELGLTAVTEAQGNANEQAEAINNMLTMDIDAFAVTGGGMDRCIQPVAAAGKTGQVRIGTIDIGEGALEALESGAVDVLLGGHAVDAVYSMVNAYNYLTETPLRDEPSEFLLNYMVIDSAETYADYLKYVAGDVFPYTVDELKAVMKYWNPDATYDDMQALISAWSVEDVKTRHADMF